MEKQMIMCDCCGQQYDKREKEKLDYRLMVPFDVGINHEWYPPVRYQFDFCTVRCLQSWIDKHLKEMK